MSKKIETNSMYWFHDLNLSCLWSALAMQEGQSLKLKCFDEIFFPQNKTISSGLLSVMNSCMLVYSWDKTNSQSSSHFNAVWNWSNAYWPPTQFYFSLKSIREMRKLDGEREKCRKKISSLIAFTLTLTSSHKHIYIDYLYRSMHTVIIPA